MLREIIANRKEQVEVNKMTYPVSELEKSPYFGRETISLLESLKRQNQYGIIAEFKRKSPSKGFINKNADILEVTTGYIKAGATALSVLTEQTYFAGSDRDLVLSRAANDCPVLRKDFIIDEYQIIESKSLGADVILLIAACLDALTLKKLYLLARSLKLDVLFEIHDEDELLKLPGEELIIGVNNRNLKTMQVDYRNSLRIAAQLPFDMVRISESGIQNASEMEELTEAGYNGFLIGEQFMQFADPGAALKKMADQVILKTSAQ